MANCPHCDYTISPQEDEGSQAKLKQHLLSRHRSELSRNKDSHEDLQRVAEVMAQKALNRGHR